MPGCLDYFGEIMIQTLLKNLLFCAIILSVLAVGQVFSQATPNPPVKRNSPFSPNPKKKVESTNTSAIEPKKVEENQGEVKIVKAEANLPTDNSAVPSNNTGEKKVEEVESQPNQNFESRSIATKTLEVAKRASAVEVSPMEIYKVGIGDVLFISLQNAPTKESTYFTVLNDGTIDYPLAGEMVQVLGLTTEQIEDTLKEKIKLYESPQVSVKVREHNSHSYTVLGLVEKSGEKFMPREAIPLFMVRAESIVLSKANRAIVKREGSPNQTIDLKDSKSSEVLIYPKDIVEFISDEEATLTQFYYISGEIASGGKKNFTNGITLTQAIIESGDLKKKSVRKVVIRRKNAEGLLVSIEFDLKAIKDGKVADPDLKVGDTIEIGN